MPSKHYRYGGSTAARTMGCPSWHKLSDTLPKKPTGASPDADRGTLLHDCMEELLLNPDVQPQDMLGRKYNDQVVTQDDIDEAIQPSLERYLAFADEHDIDIELPEEEVKADCDDETGGTSDIIAANKDTVFIFDWKFGYNVVDAEDNKQGLFYAMCARETPRLRHLFESRNKLCIVIIQPQAPNGLSAWFTTIERLNDFQQDYFAARAQVDTAEPSTGSHCKFCPAQPICPAKQGLAYKALQIPVDSTNMEALQDGLAIADEVIAWANSVKALAHEQLELGTKIKGWKLVDKRASRKWVNEQEVLATFRKSRKIKIDEVTTAKLVTPAQFEKICKKKGVDFKLYSDYIESVSSGTTLASADDKRPEAFNHSAFANAVAMTE